MCFFLLFLFGLSAWKFVWIVMCGATQPRFLRFSHSDISGNELWENKKKKKICVNCSKSCQTKKSLKHDRAKIKKKNHQNRNFFFDHSSHNSPLLMSATPQFKPYVCNASQILYRVILNENPWINLGSEKWLFKSHFFFASFCYMNPIHIVIRSTFTL